MVPVCVVCSIPVILLTSGGLINLMSNDCKEFDWRSNALIRFCMRNSTAVYM